jgi:hypothetical protein
MISCGKGRRTPAKGVVSGLLASAPPSAAESKFLSLTVCCALLLLVSFGSTRAQEGDEANDGQGGAPPKQERKCVRKQMTTDSCDSTQGVFEVCVTNGKEQLRLIRCLD